MVILEKADICQARCDVWLPTQAWKVLRQGLGVLEKLPASTLPQALDAQDCRSDAAAPLNRPLLAHQCGILLMLGLAQPEGTFVLFPAVADDWLCSKSRSSQA